MCHPRWATRPPTVGMKPREHPPPAGDSTLVVVVSAVSRAIPALMEEFWKPELPAPYWADIKLRLSQLRAPSMHALVVDLAEALSLSRHCL